MGLFDAIGDIVEGALNISGHAVKGVIKTADLNLEGAVDEVGDAVDEAVDTVEEVFDDIFE